MSYKREDITANGILEALGTPKGVEATQFVLEILLAVVSRQSHTLTAISPAAFCLKEATVGTGRLLDAVIRASLCELSVSLSANGT